MSECPRCGKEFESVQGVYSHWGYKHEGPTPENLERPDEQIEKISETLTGHEVPDEEREKISNSMEEAWESGRYTRDEVKKAKSLEEAWKKGAFDDREMSKVMEDWWAQRSEEEKQAQFEEHSQRMQELWKEIEQIGKAPKPQKVEVEETGRVVRSKPEAEVDTLLHKLGAKYEYEPRYILSDLTYTPDFEVGDLTIEVKGWPVTDRCIKRAEAFMRECSDRLYVVFATTNEAETVPANRTVTNMTELESIIDMFTVDSYPSDVAQKVVS